MGDHKPARVSLRISWVQYFPRGHFELLLFCYEALIVPNGSLVDHKRYHNKPFLVAIVLYKGRGFS
jgi:hypothetical protein